MKRKCNVRGGKQGFWRDKEDNGFYRYTPYQDTLIDSSNYSASIRVSTYFSHLDVCGILLKMMLAGLG